VRLGRRVQVAANSRGRTNNPLRDRARRATTLESGRLVSLRDVQSTDECAALLRCHSDVHTECLDADESGAQYAFRNDVDMLPLAYLRMCRLSRVRETLLASERQNTTVTAVAMRYGFLHLGRFSLDYKRAFHEAPSATLGC
jgi:hypothetical protein